MYGCKGYPSGYDFTLHNPKAVCKEQHSMAWGWLGAFILFTVAILGAYGKSKHERASLLLHSETERGKLTG